MSAPTAGRLVAEIGISPFGGNLLVVADLDGDARPEFVTMQNAGQFHSELASDRDDLDEVDRGVYCLTVFDMEGRVLWQDGEPYARDYPYTSHGGGRMMLADDVDGDGRVEVVVIRRGHLAILDGCTGRTKASTELPADNFVNLYTAALDGPGEGRQIICKVNDAAYEPWEYANPTLIYNPDLSVRRESFAVRGAGHSVVAADLDGDGRDELLMGYSYFDHDLTEKWRLDLGDGYDYARDHADHIASVDLDGSGRPVICYSGSDDFFAVDLDGKILWTADAGHAQSSAAGPWGPARKPSIILSEKNLGLHGLDRTGRVCWTRRDINGYARPGPRWRDAHGRVRSWAMFRPQFKPDQSVPFVSDPAWSEHLWPSFMDGDGQLYPTLPWSERYAMPPMHIRARRSYDCGLVYQMLIRDLDHDGLDEVLVHTRHNLWIFRSG